jgi:hypothetical protein
VFIMASIHSDKENIVAFRVPPKTPAGKHHTANVRTPAHTVLAAKSLNATAFVTPALGRAPLAGKDTNVRTGKDPIGGKMTGFFSSGRKKSPIVTEAAHNKTFVMDGRAIPNFEDLEIEFIPDRPRPLPDLPLDHIELDYEAIRKASAMAIFHDREEPTFDDRLDGNLDEQLDIVAFDVQDLKPLALTEAAKVKRLQQPLNRIKATKPSFMTPTFSAQAKSVQHRTRPIQAHSRLASNKPKLIQRPGPIDLDVSIEELEGVLDL